MKKLGAKILGIYLIILSLTHLIGLSFSGMGILLGILALVAGILLLVER